MSSLTAHLNANMKEIELYKSEALDDWGHNSIFLVALNGEHSDYDSILNHLEEEMYANIQRLSIESIEESTFNASIAIRIISFEGDLTEDELGSMLRPVCKSTQKL